MFITRNLSPFVRAVFRGLPKKTPVRYYSIQDVVLEEYEELHPSLIKRAKDLEVELSELEKKISGGLNFDVNISKKFSKLASTIEIYQNYVDMLSNVKELKDIVNEANQDPEMEEEAINELLTAIPDLIAASAKLRTRLLPEHPFAEKASMLEFRPGVGGSEAAIFTEDLLNMYQSYAHHNNWKSELISLTEAPGAGITEAVLTINEAGSFDRLRFESGVHRVQRVPDTEKLGRVHTSTAAIVVLPQMSDERDLDIKDMMDTREFKPEDIKIETMRSRGKGGQHVNTTDSAVRLTHYPSGILVMMQTERSQHRNKARAFEILRARLAEREQAAALAAEKKLRTDQVTTTDRSDKIRTYNYVQNRITDHRCGFSLFDLPNVMNGTRLDEMIDAVEAKETEDRCNALTKEM
ncbi:hypothetical protein BABINDRAFT_160923 [Babjeviella inositovora NRRL Y-12698]|uniref:Peptide chain release factor 1, mitochondrial n=1 Tax=Babjeviella inositovora NRRL Y-12698 TaxID=984486 RepID=A0A1E3QSS4_9ASCO|nr:uncharacterized protein BABINDRAFT_160923 [Babjeviella inositovora NRRL Y-12698]ODQ80688.1 hypothetical protein BABINDRAFT_160923 [Babjeviella inositovora NRRL Y-12698]